MDSLGWSSGYAPLAVDFIPKGCVRTLSVVDMHGIGYMHPQTQIDSVTDGQIDPGEGPVS